MSSPATTSSSSVTSSEASPRFSLLILEPGEIYFEDYLVYYHELNSPFASASNSCAAPQKGYLKVCSKSVVFDPLSLSQPLVKFPFKAIEHIVDFTSETTTRQQEDDEDIYADNGNSTASDVEQLKSKCFALDAKQIVLLKAHNRIAPYQTRKTDARKRHFFQFLFTDVGASLGLLCQLHRASTLANFQQEELMLQSMLRSCVSRVKFDPKSLEDVHRERLQLELVVNKIEPLVTNPGKVLLSNMCLYYVPFNNVSSVEQRLVKIRLEHVKYVIKRRYHLKRVGCEIVFERRRRRSDSSSDEEVDELKKKKPQHQRSQPYLYLTFQDEKERDLFYTKLVVEQRTQLTSLNELGQENMMQKWRVGNISNYEYLMYLNSMADRSYNDLTQYPVFPWVLSSYEQLDELDLDDPATFRDLSKPVGALNEERLVRFRQRCFEMQAATTTFSSDQPEQNQPLFLYGSHYSTPAFVLFYLVRRYPEWQLCLQSGRFDHSDRLFHSITDTWKNCLRIDSDVKELIPEFYDTEDEDSGQFLLNVFDLDLGTRQDGTRVNHVTLPRWAHQDPRAFVRKMRDALESPYVSEHLHEWIDLIFGYKQRGDEALRANNLFYYLCYEGAVDLDAIDDFAERQSLEMQIQEFGQIPTQLFERPHEPRLRHDMLADIKRITSATRDLEMLDEAAESATTKQPPKKPPPTTSPSRKASTPTTGLVLNRRDSRQNSSATTTPTTPTGAKRQQKWQLPNQNPYRIHANNVKELEVRLNVGIHKSQVNDSIFIENTHRHHQSKTTEDGGGFDKTCLPLVCSVSGDNWMKIYSLEDRSVFRSHNVCDLCLSSVDCFHLLEPSSTEPRTLLLLSCWDNNVYLYDLNYNRCVYTLSSAHDDAVSRVRLINTAAAAASSERVRSNSNASSCSSSSSSSSLFFLTSSWDSLLKLWRLPIIKQQDTLLSSPQQSTVSDAIRAQFMSELCHDSAVVDFELSATYMASLCDDGNVHLWRIKFQRHHQSDLTAATGSSEEDTDQDEVAYAYMYSIPTSSGDLGKITDCKIMEIENNQASPAEETSGGGTMSSSLNLESTVAICTSLGYVKIYNLMTKFELFSLRIAVPGGVKQQQFAKLSKMYYTHDYILLVDAAGYLYFIDLMQQQQQKTTTTTSQSELSQFLGHTMRLSEQPLTSLSVYRDTIVCAGDQDGQLYLLAIFDL